MWENGALLAQAPAHEGTAGLAHWLQKLIYGNLLSDKQLANAASAAEQGKGFVIQENELLESEGWELYFTRKLLEQGVVTYTVKHMHGCLSSAKSATWGRNSRGVEVPDYRLPDDVTL